MTEENAEFDHHHHHHPRPDEAAIAVRKWIPQAVTAQPQHGRWAVLSGAYSFPLADSEMEAWEAAFTVMQSVNSFFLWVDAGYPEGTALEDWLDAAGNIENGPEATPPPPVE